MLVRIEIEFEHTVLSVTQEAPETEAEVSFPLDRTAPRGQADVAVRLLGVTSGKMIAALGPNLDASLGAFAEEFQKIVTRTSRDTAIFLTNVSDNVDSGDEERL